ncbi:MAG: PD40 domain-containing protein [Phycisphaeraceae bacterium]|nr:PD40 domain-containing protein [Phycisphaeraceae bacterium]
MPRNTRTGKNTVPATYILAIAAASASLLMACATTGPKAPTIPWHTVDENFSSERAEALGAIAGQTRVGYPRMPSLSPDGSIIAFTWAGDLWAVPREGGIAARLTTHPADDLRSEFSPDGSTIVFESTRDGSTNLYAMPIATDNGRVIAGPVRRLTLSDRGLTLSGFHPDGQAVLVHARLEPGIERGTNMYRVPINGGAITRLTDAQGLTPRISNDGNTIIFTRQRDLNDRPAYQGPAAGDLWALDTRTGRFKQLTRFNGNDAQGFPLPDGSVLYVSSRHGQNNIWRIPAGQTDAIGPRRITNFTPTEQQVTIGHGVQHLNVSHDGSIAVFLVWDTLYTIDLNQPGAQPTPVEIYASGDTKSLDTRLETLDRQASEAALSPDGKTLAVVARGEVFIRSTDEDRPTRRVTFTAGREQDIAWSPDNQFLYFSSDENGQFGIYRAAVAFAREDLKATPARNNEQPKDQAEDQPGEQPEGASKETPKPGKVDHGKRWAEAIQFEVQPFIITPERTVQPMPSPDGYRLLYIRERGDLWLRELATGHDRLVFPSWNVPNVQWASDSTHIVYSIADFDFNSDIWLLNLDDQEAKPINLTRHPDIDASPNLSADGKVLTFLSDRAGENGSYDAYAVFLDRALEGIPDYETAKYFDDAAKAVNKKGKIDTPDYSKQPDRKPLQFHADDAWQRVRRITSLNGIGNLAMTPGGDRILFTTSIDGSTSLFSVDYKGQDRKSVQAGPVSNVTPTIDGTKVLFLRTGQATTARPAGGSTTTLGISATLRIDVDAEQAQKFKDAANMIGREFYHPTLKGLDWPALTQRYLKLARVTRTPSEFYQVTNFLFGELNGSHLGISGGTQLYSPPAIRTGYLGVDTQPVPGGYKVTYTIPEGPASRKNSPLNPGDIITAINAQPLAQDMGMPMIELREALAGTAGQETLVEIIPANPDTPSFVLIVPASSAAEANLRYDDAVRQRRASVEQLSNGRLGYLHIRGMNEPSLRDFERDLFAAADGKDALIIDVRDNGGGWTNDILLSSLTAPRHAYTIPRGANPSDVPHDAYPRDRRLIYAYTRPIAVICNENSFSNAEIFSHAIKNIGRGKLVGRQTFGGVISTGSYTLIDGTTVRRPFRGWYLPDGTDMENNGAIPDVPVDITPTDQAQGKDPQLEAAVKTLLDGLK